MKKIIFIALLLISVQSFAQNKVYSLRDTISGGTDTTYIYLDGEYNNVSLVIANTTGTPTLTGKVNYADNNAWYTCYVTTNYGTSAASLALAGAEGTIYQFVDQAIRRIKLYISGGTLRFELKATRR